MHSDITFDPLKDAINCLQHGVSLGLARDIAWDNLIRWVDDRYDYGELREVGLAPLRGHIFCVVFTRRDNQRRIISLRRANKREIKRYGIDG
ncbi:BrnT family toxin [Caballeronia sp. LZ065]|uniref:BrnT family toxin n=1 Tax=Caballeronia sp. LZ065 TaxID=3038571 RepID=UPI002866FD0F|nr:BrnT family toxin [Caballeronia sp. LZ065]MDR5783234.1 BrnT family toxin [Caballeronia sp. LZ065]